MAMAGAGDYFARNREEFKRNIVDYEYVREQDLVLTHTLVNLQRNRAPVGTPVEDRTDVALSVVRRRTRDRGSGPPRAGHAGPVGR